jgi:probable HAF family extracellular repeat protein
MLTFRIVTSGLLAVAAAVSSITPTACASPPPRYVARPIGALPGGYTYVRGLNNLGQFTGDSGSYEPATRWKAIVGQPDGSVEAIHLPAYAMSGGWAINDAGQVAGIASAVAPPPGYHDHRLFVYTPGVGTVDLGWPAADLSGYIVDMNQLGDVTGYWYVSANAEHTFLYRHDGGLVELSAGGRNEPRDINNNGQVVGDYGDSGGQHGYRWDGTTFTDIGTLGGTSTSAYYISDDGTIVGSSQPTPPTWQDHAILRTPGGELVDLQPPGATTSNATWITEDGLVVGQYSDALGNYRGFYQYPGQAAQDMGVSFQMIWEGVTRVNAVHEMIGTTVDQNYMPQPFYYSAEAGFHRIADLVVNPQGLTVYDAVAINDHGTILVNDMYGPLNGSTAHLLIQIHPGDLNGDGIVSFADIDPFVQLLADPDGWQRDHPQLVPENGDLNGDGVVTFADIDPFVALLGQ